MADLNVKTGPFPSDQWYQSFLANNEPRLRDCVQALHITPSGLADFSNHLATLLVQHDLRHDAKFKGGSRTNAIAKRDAIVRDLQQRCSFHIHSPQVVKKALRQFIMSKRQYAKPYKALGKPTSLLDPELSPNSLAAARQPPAITTIPPSSQLSAHEPISRETASTTAKIKSLFPSNRASQDLSVTHVQYSFTDSSSRHRSGQSTLAVSDCPQCLKPYRLSG